MTEPWITRVTRDLTELGPRAWNALQHDPSPFLEYGFLSALVTTGSVGAKAGWDPHVVIVERKRAGGAVELVGAVMCFAKSHSYGEYIFDWAWARASHRARIPYYPKLVVAAPLTPASGRRLLLARDLGPADVAQVTAQLLAGVQNLAHELGCSSIHWLFTTPEEQVRLQDAGYLSRVTFQYHWHNRGYASFEAFLAGLTSRKRKQIRKERERAGGLVDTIDFVDGKDLEPEDLAAMDRFYRDTTARHGGTPYLAPGFFAALAKTLPERVRMARARKHGRTVAGAWFLETHEALYGRYWGGEIDAPMLHFELAYYRGIERCITHGTSLFEAGAQGEHKLLRGFLPAPTHSSHWVFDPRLRQAIQQFLALEREEVRVWMQTLAEHSPYRCEPST